MPKLLGSIAFVFLALSLLPLSLLAQAPPTDDTYSNSSKPNTKYGSGFLLAVQPGSNSYIKFNLSTLPPTPSISKATLRLYVDAAITGGSFDVYEIDSSWAEGTLTYTNAPALGASATAGNPVALTTASKNQFVLVDITSLVQSWANGSVANNGVALALTTSTGSFSFDSKESILTSHHPELEIVFNGPQGPQGPAGPQGPQGNTGATGLQGPIGNTGSQGPQGAVGSQGPAGPTGATGAQGPVGPQGPQGNSGANGSQGPIGNTGPQGPQGVVGSQGPQGPQGNTGSTGPQGPQGVAGNLALAGQSCSTGASVTGFDASGNLVCTAAPSSGLVIATVTYATAGAIYSGTISGTSGDTYTCTVTDGTIVSGGSGYIPGTIYFSALSPGTLAVSCFQTDPNGNASAPVSANITVLPVLVAPTIQAPSSVAAGSQFNIASCTGGGSTYAWAISNGLITSLGGSSNPSANDVMEFTAGASGSITISCVATDLAGNISPPTTVSVTIQ